MEEKKKNIDRDLKDSFKEIGLNRPSTAFLHQIMTEIQEKEDQKIYEPVISRKWWVGIAAAVLGLISLSFFMDGGAWLSQWIPTEKVPQMQMPSIDLSSGITVSKSVSIGILLGVVLLLVQMVALKNRLARSFEL
ncbi:hypothetical protein GWK08_01975 [Leptobacterium flavescens]|uniref:Uncharacterized protein n=1 Tax=Leptobacterium flavescens TaxID=472055 RepID=A0A6P0UJY7_9FLAO|nr:hypothetical protein [Leptobacterium flavescens]NER12198.1 hypothetical protein [Leptobacterium flavescens]